MTASNLSRRTAFKRAGLAGLGLAAAPLLPAAARAAHHAEGEMATLPDRPVFNQGNLGAFTVMTVLDLARQLPGPHPIFGEDQPAEEVASYAEAHFLPGDQMEIGFTPTIVDTGEGRVLFDTGNGGDAGKLVERMMAAGIDPASITTVVITHMHPDHVGGLMNGETPTFANADYVTGAREFNFWTSGDAVADHIVANVLPLADRFRQIEPGDDVVTGITAIEAFGHTPGHMAFNVESEGKRLVVTADAANHYVVSLQKPEWHVRFDMDKEAAVRTRKELFGMIAADKVPFIGYHMPFPSVGYIEPMDGGGFRYVAASYQLYL